MIKWHSTLRERLIRTNSAHPSYDEKWANPPPPPKKRTNVDQSPLPLAIDTTRTFEEQGQRGGIENRKKRSGVHSLEQVIVSVFAH